VELREGTSIHPALFLAIAIAVIQVLAGVGGIILILWTLIATYHNVSWEPLMLGSSALLLMATLLALGFLCKFRPTRNLLIAEFSLAPLALILRVVHVSHRAGRFSPDAIGLILVACAIALLGTCCFMASPVKSWCNQSHP
jgi:hypothetical protein